MNHTMDHLVTSDAIYVKDDGLVFALSLCLYVADPTLCINKS